MSKSVFFLILLFASEGLAFLNQLGVNQSDKYQEITKEMNLRTFYDDVRNLVADIIRKTMPQHCYALITDEIYEQVIYERKLFDAVDRKSHFVISLKTSEYFDEDPSFEIKCMLEEIKKHSCDVYLILISNGIQMKSLLRYGDKNRLLNTRGQFIILHDYRLLKSDFHYIWKRIVNVIFIRQFDKYHKGSIEAGKWFELSTVPYPFPLKGVFVAKLMDYWNSGRYKYNRELFYDKTSDLNGEKLRVVVLKHNPAVFVEIDRKTKEKIYTGLEIELINALAHRNNFVPDFYETEDSIEEKWGRMYENGSYTGVLGEMSEGIADIALADLHYTLYHLEIMDLSIPYNTECLTFLTPESTSDNSWQTLILPFSQGMWIGVCVSLICVGTIFYLFSNIYFFFGKPKTQQTSRRKIGWKEKLSIIRIKENLLEIPSQLKKGFTNSISTCKKNKQGNPKIKKVVVVAKKRKQASDIFDDFSNCIVYTYSMLLVVSIPKLPSRWSVRVLTGWWWIYCVLVVVAYRAALTAILANPQPRLTIDKLEVLAKSPIKCGAWGEQNLLIFQNSLDEAGRSVGTKIEHIDDPESVVPRIIKGEFAVFENDLYLREIRFKHQTDPTETSLHIMEECVIHMPVSLGLEKNSPLKPIVDDYVRRAIETGLTSKWLSDAIRNFESSTEEPPREALMDLKKFIGAIVALISGYILGFLALVIEKLYWKFVIQKNPLYDKFSNRITEKSFIKNQPEILKALVQQTNNGDSK